MTYNVFSGTLNPTQSINLLLSIVLLSNHSRPAKQLTFLLINCQLSLPLTNLTKKMCYYVFLQYAVI